MSVVVLSVDIDSIISNRFDSNIEQEAQFTFYCANSLYELNRMQCTLNQEKQERNRKEYVELVKKSALNQKLLDQNIEEYNSLIEEYESLKKQEMPKPDLESIKANLKKRENSILDIFSLNKVLCAVLSLIVVIISGFDKLMQHQLEWIKNRDATESLKSEISKYKFGISPYSAVDEENNNARLFVENVEAIISKDVSEFRSNRGRLSDFETQYHDDVNKRFEELNHKFKDLENKVQNPNSNPGEV